MISSWMKSSHAENRIHTSLKGDIFVCAHSQTTQIVRQNTCMHSNQRHEYTHTRTIEKVYILNNLIRRPHVFEHSDQKKTDAFSVCVCVCYPFERAKGSFYRQTYLSLELVTGTWTHIYTDIVWWHMLYRSLKKCSHLNVEPLMV